MKRWEQAAQRRVREAERMEKLRLKDELRSTAVQAVEQYNELLQVLTSVHKEPIEGIDWRGIQEEQPPVEPTAANRYEQEATTKWQQYQPSFFDKLLGKTASKKAQLEQGVKTARDKDQSSFEQAKKEYIQQHEEWERMRQLAGRVLNKNLAAYNEAIELFDPFSGLTGLGSPPIITFNPDYVEVNLVAQTDDTVPKFTGCRICKDTGGTYRAGPAEGVGDRPINLVYLYPKAMIAMR